MKKNLKQSAKKRNKPTSPWIKYCLIGGLILLLVAGALYGYRYMSLDREFHHNIKSFGEETYKEIFSLDDTKKKAENLMDFAEEAFSFVGTEAEAEERFGLLARYSCTDPNAVSQEHTLDYIISKINDKGGYVWVAYASSYLDPRGECIYGAGSEDRRILTRWTVAADPEGNLTVTEIKEGA